MHSLFQARSQLMEMKNFIERYMVRKICELLLKKYCKPGKLLKNRKK